MPRSTLIDTKIAKPATRYPDVPYESINSCADVRCSMTMTMWFKLFLSEPFDTVKLRRKDHLLRSTHPGRDSLSVGLVWVEGLFFLELNLINFIQSAGTIWLILRRNRRVRLPIAPTNTFSVVRMNPQPCVLDSAGIIVFRL